MLRHPTAHFEVDASTSAITDLEPPAGIETVAADLTLKLVVARETLRLEMDVHNGGSRPFLFSTVLHTYFSVNAMPVTVRGLQVLDCALG